MATRKLSNPPAVNDIVDSHMICKCGGVCERCR